MANLRTDVSVDAAAVAGAGGEGVTGGAMRILGHPVAAINMQLQLVRGSFLPADAGPATDPKVWRRLPGELAEEVAKRVPAGASQFRLQSVSRAWRRVLTSADFSRIAAAAEQQQERGMVAIAGRTSSSISSSNCSVGVNPKLVDIDLASFVPESFWYNSECRNFAVVAAANGLVCIHSYTRKDPWRVYRYCVLNPLTRTCKVLPRLPRDCTPEKCLALIPTAVTILGSLWPRRGMLVTTYDLAGADGGGDWDCAAYRPAEEALGDGWVNVALCAGKIFMSDGRWIHVLEPGSGGTLVQKTTMFAPIVWPALPGVDFSQCCTWTPVAGYPGVQQPKASSGLVAHRGALFFYMKPSEKQDREVDLLIYVWRLALDEPIQYRFGDRWEAVAWLHVADLERLTGLKGLNRKGVCQVWSRYLCGVQESLWLYVKVGRRCFLLGFNLDTREWELAHDNKQSLLHSASAQHEQQESEVEWDCVPSKPFELRPDLFL